MRGTAPRAPNGRLTDEARQVVGLVKDLGAQLQKGGGCAVLYYRTLFDIVILNDTLSALTIGMTLPYLAGMDAEEDFTALRDQFNELLVGFLVTEE